MVSLLSETSEQTSASVVAFGDPLSVYRSLFGGLKLSSSSENCQKGVLYFKINSFSVRKPTQATATRVATGGYKLGNIVDFLVVRETGSVP